MTDESAKACPKCGVVFEKLRERADQENAKERISKSTEEILDYQRETRENIWNGNIASTF